VQFVPDGDLPGNKGVKTPRAYNELPQAVQDQYQQDMENMKTMKPRSRKKQRKLELVRGILACIEAHRESQRQGSIG
jgi:hypothetical protein